MLFIDGFEQFKDDPNLDKALPRAGYGYNRLGALMPIAGRSLGGTGLRTVGSAFSRKLPWLSNKFSAGFASFMETRGVLLTLRFTNDVSVVVWVNPETGIPMLGGKEGGSLPWLKTWYYYEIEIDRTTGQADLVINGRAEVQSYALPPAVLTANEVTVVWGTAPVNDGPPGFPPTRNLGHTATYDDVYAHDGPRMTPLAITTRFATSTLSAGWEHSPVAGSNHGAVSLRPPKPLDVNVQAAAIGTTDVYASTMPLVNNNEIVATGVCVLARKSPELDAALGVFIGDNANAVYRDGSIELSGDWVTRYITFLPNPVPDPMLPVDTKAGLEAAPFGIQVAASP